MGLLDPSEGTISVDGVPITRENRQRWWRSIAHVPQAIFLSDGSIAENIAFGVPPDRLKMEEVREAAEHAQLDDFIASLPEGYDTQVGERGVRLSGGQRQRLGLARAIYKRAPVLVLDEATSALDDETEEQVMAALQQLGDRGRTIIIIAHRLTTTAHCDTVVRMENGRIAAIGTYDSIVETPTAKSRRSTA
jgi:ATP-binding cassette subfamily B protein